MSVDVRAPSALDAPAIARMHNASARAAHAGLIPPSMLDAVTDEWLTGLWLDRLQRAAPGEFIRIATEGDDIVGYCLAGPDDDDDADPALVAELRLLYVSPERWRSGIGRRLVGHALGYLTDTGFKEVTLWTLAGDHRAHEFYAAMGWKPDGARRVMGQTDSVTLRYRRGLP